MPSSIRDFDAIVVGARVAGTAAAIFLARAAKRVLLVDKATFPSDTISTHIVLTGGTRVLENLGALEILERAGGVRFDTMRTVGPGFDYQSDLRRDGDDLRGLCLGRLAMDAAMVDAARAHESVAFRSRFRVTDLLIDRGAVTGIRGEDSHGVHEFHAPLTIGADGVHGIVAKIANQKFGAFPATDVPCARAYYYAYFKGVDRARLGDGLITEFDSEGGEASLVCRCDGDRVVAAIAFDARNFGAFRTDVDGNFRAMISRTRAVSDALAGAEIASRVYSIGLLRNTLRIPATDGALLLGDSGLHVDPLFGQGHSFALMSASIFGELAPAWFSARAANAITAESMADFAARRERELGPHYNASVRVSRAFGIDTATIAAHRAAAREQWAADEMVRFALMAGSGDRFPSFRFARLMAAARRAA